MRNSSFKRQTFNDIDYALLGYNTLKGYPLEAGMDPGFAAPIFTTDYTNRGMSADCRFNVPNGLHVYPEISCQTSFSSEEIKSRRELQTSFAASVAVSGGGWGAQFSASASFAKDASKVSTGESVLIMSQATCRYYKTRLDTETPPALHDNFINKVNSIVSAATTDKESAVHDFLDVYGTHFFTDIDFGARYTKEHEMSFSQYEVASSRSIAVSAQASFSGVVQVGGGASLSTDQREAASDFQKRVKTTTITIGATPPASGDAMEWASTVKDDPMPIRFSLSSIEDLFTSQFMSAVPNFDDARTALLAHRGTYCADLSDRLGVDNTCDVVYSGEYQQLSESQISCEV